MKLAATADVVVVAGGEVRNSHGCEEDVEDAAVLVSFSRMALAETEVDFGTTEVRMMDTATALVFLTDFLSDEEDGSGEDVAERLPFPDPAAAAAGDEEDLAYSGSTRQAVGVSKSILCLLNR